jgi:hypothetical protein
MEGVYRDEAQLQHLAAIRQSDAHDYLYDCLSILDNKAAALLQYDSIVLAAATLALTLLPKNVSAGSILIIASLVLSGLSSVSCLQVIWVYWTRTVDFSMMRDKERFATLIRKRNHRTIMYRLSWILAQLSVFFLLAGVIYREL